MDTDASGNSPTTRSNPNRNGSPDCDFYPECDFHPAGNGCSDCRANLYQDIDANPDNPANRDSLANGNEQAGDGLSLGQLLG